MEGIFIQICCLLMLPETMKNWFFSSARQILSLPYVKSMLNEFIEQKEYQLQLRALKEKEATGSSTTITNSKSLLQVMRNTDSQLTLSAR